MESIVDTGRGREDSHGVLLRTWLDIGKHSPAHFLSKGKSREIMNSPVVTQRNKHRAQIGPDSLTETGLDYK